MDKKNRDSQLSHFPESYWLNHTVPEFPPLKNDLKTDVAIIGGGIVGIITAYLLAKEGKKVALIEAKELLSGVTGHTTAKITSQHSLIYNELIQTFGKEKARLYYEANNEGLDFIKRTTENLSIDCDLEIRNAVLYATTEKGSKQIEKEARAYEDLDITGTLSSGKIDELPFETSAALSMPDQAQFHPVKYLSHLIQEIRKLGGVIFEQTRAVGTLKSETGVLMEYGAVLTCNDIVVATHYPFNDFNGLYFSKLTIKRSYALTAKSDCSIKGMYLSVESPARSLRSVKDEDGKDLLLIGGDSHQTGKSDVPTQEHYTDLHDFGRKWFDIHPVSNHWSAQDMTTLDKLPYIGQMSRTSKHIYVATGFNKWGMAMGASAGMILSDRILNKPNRYSALFDPTRIKFKSKDIQQFTKKNVAVGKDLVVTLAKRPHKVPEDLEIDEGGLVSVNGKKAGGYRDKEGKIHLVKTTCTHMGCGLTWNDGERSWDCPCHGSRFSYSGDVLDGPAVKPLKKLE